MTLRLPKFEYLAPGNVNVATEMLRDHGPQAMLVAGGTDLYPNMKRRQFTPQVLIGLRGCKELYGIGPHPTPLPEGKGAAPPLSQGEGASPLPPGGGGLGRGGVPSTRSTQDSIRIGACTTLAEIAGSPLIRERYPALATAAGLVSTPQLRNMGTIGGNICLDTRCNYYDQSAFWRKALGYCMKLEGDVCRVAVNSPTCLATFSSDPVPALIGYDASVRIVGPTGHRVVPLRELYQMDGMHWIKVEHDEIVAEVTIPDPQGLHAVYYKLRERGSFDFPIAGVFVGIHTDEAGLIDRARLVLTGVYSMPVELTDAESVLVGNRLEPDVITAAADAAYAASRPVDNTASTIIQRRRTIRVFVRRALEELSAGNPSSGATTS